MINIKRVILGLCLIIGFVFAIDSDNWGNKTEYHGNLKIDRSYVVGVNVPFGGKGADGLSYQILELNCVNNEDFYIVLWNIDENKVVNYNPEETEIIINSKLFLSKDDFVDYESGENVVRYLVDGSYLDYLPQLFKDKIIIATIENGKAERAVYDVSGVGYTTAYKNCFGG